MAKRGQARTKRAWRTPTTLAGILLTPQDCAALSCTAPLPRTHPLTISGRSVGAEPHSLPSGSSQPAAMSSSEPPSYSDDDEAVSQQAQAGLCSTALQSADSSEKGQQKEQGSEEGERPERRMGSQLQPHNRQQHTHNTAPRALGT